MRWLVALLASLALVRAVKLKVVMHSEEDSRLEDDVPHLPFLKTSPPTTQPPARQMHPNELIFPLIYRQSHINSMFKFGENWYTWSTEKRTDGSKAINYYICYDEPKHCDEIGWERTDSVPKCAFQIDSLLAEDRVCLNPFGVEPHATGLCDGAEQMKVSELLRACGARVRSLWRFARAGPRPVGSAKPADVNSLLCDDEDECYISIEYRIHHDRITFSLHEPARGQTFKSALKRSPVEEEPKATEPPRPRVRVRTPHDKRTDTRANTRQQKMNKVHEDISEDTSE